MSVVLTNISDDDRRSLMHYRTPGSKNGQRRYQNPDGSLTPEGYKYYAEMYGWGTKKRSELATESDEDRAKREARIAKTAEKIEKLENKTAKYEKKSAKFEKRAGKSAKRAKNMQEFAEAKSLTKALFRRQGIAGAQQNYLDDDVVVAIVRQNNETKRLSSKSEKFRRKAERGQKKLEKYRKMMSELLPEEEKNEKERLEHSGIPTDLFDIFDELNETQQQALYALFDDIFPDDWLDDEAVEHGDGELMHWRTKGSKNGVRRYQNEDGSLTPEGYQHYKEMYGWGDKKNGTSDNTDTAEKDKRALKKEQRTKAEEEKAKAKEEKERKRDEEAEARAEERRKIYETDQKKMVDDIMARVQAKQEEARKREADAEEEKKSREEELRSARSLTDDELNKAIGRLQKEKQYSELLNERSNREKGPIAAMASKLFKEAAENLARKALNAIADEATKKLVKKLSGDDGSNINNNQPNNKPQGNQPTGGNGQKFSKAEKSQIRSMASSGNSLADIAKALGATEDRVKDYMAAAGITIT